MTLELISSPENDLRNKFITDVPKSMRLYQFSDLIPNTTYSIQLAAMGTHRAGNSTNPVTFSTIMEDDIAENEASMRTGEIIVIVLILVAWACALALFYHKWKGIRVLQPPNPRYKHSPKNLDTIKVVKRATDSVIYKSYTRQYSKTLLAREKHIARMSTMPELDHYPGQLKIDSSKKQGTMKDDAMRKDDTKGSAIPMHRVQTMPMMLEKDEDQENTSQVKHKDDKQTKDRQDVSTV
ncbi:unnamed protein product [Owenia fusiformis]|nr:unnamed protein product [Owenia fusiformis]